MLKQKSLFEFAGVHVETSKAIQIAVAHLSTASSEDRGAIFTKRSVVEFILDLAGYQANKPLRKLRVLEPSFGDGDFLFPLLDRLIATIPVELRCNGEMVASLTPCIRGVELHRDTFCKTRERIRRYLDDNGFTKTGSRELVEAWFVEGDFLLTDLNSCFDVVIGNPPYLRQEKIPAALIAEYRRRFETIYDRADLYIPFIEHSLSLLADKGRLCFICADRWMKNRYGGPLRNLIAKDFHLNAFVSLTTANAFHDEVTAYPAITLITREPSGPTRVAMTESIEAKDLRRLADNIIGRTLSNAEGIHEVSNIANGAAPWILESSTNRDIVRRLESQYPTLEEAGCKVGIGVATGADKAFIAPFDSLDVEDSRKIPLAMTKDIVTGMVVWNGYGVVNPFEDDGRLAILEEYPRFKRYLLDRKEQIAGRHVAKKSPAHWYRTIDRIYPELAATPKLLIPDIKGEANVVFEAGNLYPHHNLYYITSLEWDLRALQTVLRSGIAALFVACYTTKMRGGYLRFQAQYLRKIRIPRWSSVPSKVKKQLIATCSVSNPEICNQVVAGLFGIDDNERDLLGWTNERNEVVDGA